MIKSAGVSIISDKMRLLLYPISLYPGFTVSGTLCHSEWRVGPRNSGVEPRNSGVGPRNSG